MTRDQLIEAGQDPWVQAICNLFGARIIEIKEPEQAQPKQEEQLSLL